MHWGKKCTLFKKDYQMIQDSRLLLDVCLAINIIYNLHLVMDIHEVNQRWVVSINASTGSINLKATLNPNILPIQEEVWFDYNNIAKIIALHHVQCYFKISYSNWFGSDNNAFVVIKPDNTMMKFPTLKRGLYYTNTSSLIRLPPNKEGVFN